LRSEREPIELALASGIPTELNVLDREVNSQFDVDLLWTEFGVSGNTAVLNPLLAVLERVDVMRTKLEEYLKNPPSRRRRELLSELLEEDLQLELNEAGEKIVSPEDVDVVFGSAIDGERKSKILRRIRRAVFIETKELSHVQLKTYVFKSLERMLPRHAKLLGALAEKIPELHESTRALLTPKLATAYFQTKRFKEATKWYQELTKIRPKDHEVLRKLSLAALRGGDYRLARAALEELKKRDKRRYREVNEEFEFKLMQLLPAQGEATDLKLEELVSACNSLKSYSSEFRFFGPQLNEAVSDRPRSESLYWRFAYEAPNSFSVVYFDAEDIISTRWITIGSELFEMDPKWVRVKDQTEIQNKRSTNSFLTERKWCTLLSSLDSQQMFIGEESSVDFIFLKGFGKNPKGFPETGFKGEQNFELLYWAERSSGLPLRGELTISGKSRKYVDFNVQYQQLFRAHNQRQYISAPEVEESNETKEDEKEPQELIDRI